MASNGRPPTEDEPDDKDDEDEGAEDDEQDEEAFQEEARRLGLMRRPRETDTA